MSFPVLVLLALVQGITELFPVSSLGHTLLVPGLLGIHIHQQAPQLIPFLVALHLGTALALLGYFRKRWYRLAGGVVRQFKGEPNKEGRLMWALVIGTVPAGLVGLLLEKPLEALFHDLRIVAAVLVVNGVCLWGGGKTPKPARVEDVGDMTFKQGFWVGLAQIGALIPGFSRSGLTMLAGNRAGLGNAAAAEFSFLLGTPIILAAAVLELPKLFSVPNELMSALAGGVLTAVAAWLSLRFLMRYFENKGSLSAFGLYCMVTGFLALFWFAGHSHLS